MPEPSEDEPEELPLAGAADEEDEVADVVVTDGDPPVEDEAAGAAAVVACGTMALDGGTAAFAATLLAGGDDGALAWAVWELGELECFPPPKTIFPCIVEVAEPLMITALLPMLTQQPICY
jgi:hypothetical protein